MSSSGLPHAVWAGVVLAFSVTVMAPDSVQWAARVGGMLQVREDPDPDVYLRESNYYRIKVSSESDLEDHEVRELVLDNLVHGYVVNGNPRQLDYAYERIYASIMERAGAMPASHAESGDGSVTPRPLKTLFVGGGSYTYPRFIEAAYPGSSMLVMEIDPAVTRAAHEALFLPDDTPIETRWGDARTTVDQLLAEKARDPAGFRPFDFIFGDAFNDFSVPWHLTTREFNDKIAQLLAPDGVYMINIIDNFQFAKFLGAYVQTARSTFGGVAVFSTDPIQSALPLTFFLPTATAPLSSIATLVPGVAHFEDYRETFVIAMSRASMDWTELGARTGERSFTGYVLTDLDMEVATQRSGRVILTDDFAPVENLLAKVARDR